MAPVLSAVHRAVLADGRWEAPALPSSALDDDAWDDLVRETEAHRTLGWLSWAVADGRLPVADAKVQPLFERHAELMTKALVLEREAMNLAGLVGANSSPPIALKGVASANVDHPEASLRVFEDIDLLVPADEIDDVVSILRRHGCERDLPPRRAHWDRRFAKDIAMVAPSGAEIDLHRTLVPGPFGFSIDLDELRDGVESVPLGSSTVCVLGVEQRVLAAALALTVGEAEPRASAALDMLAALAQPSLDPVRLDRLAGSWRIEALLVEALRWCEDNLGAGAVPGPFRTHLDSSVRGRWWRRVYRSAGGSNTATLLAAPFGMRRLRDRLAYLAGLLWPDATYRLARRRSIRPTEWRAGLREVVRWRR